MTRQADPSAAAAAHAEALAHAVAELLRFSREGPSTPRYPFGLDDVSVILADALLFTLRTEVAALRADPEADTPCDREEMDAGQNLCTALAKWLEYAASGSPED